jgi:hypothetical protein
MCERKGPFAFSAEGRFLWAMKRLHLGIAAMRAVLTPRTP